MSSSHPDHHWSLNPAPDKSSWSCIPIQSEQISETEEQLTTGPHSRSRLRILIKVGLPLLLGQLLAGLIALTAICSAFLVQNDISLPLSQNLFHYILLCLVFLSILAVRTVWRKCHSVPHIPDNASSCDRSHLKRLGLYALAGLIDAHANWSIVAAYSFTSVTSVQLLDCLSIPTAMLLSALFLRYRFVCTHYVAMVICLLGAGGMVAADVLANPPTNTSNALNVTGSNQTNSDVSQIVLGDFLVIIGAMAYAASNVLQQYLVMRYGIVNFLAYAGITAAVPTGIYAFLLERDGLWHLFTEIPKSASFGVVFQCLSGYVAAMFLLYSLMPRVLAKTSAVLVNMSLLTADVYALLMGIFLFHYHFHALYILCFIAILFGVGLFSYRVPLIRDEPSRCVTCFRRSTCKKQLPEVTAALSSASGDAEASRPTESKFV
ncbi:unnamed protein product [Echinostoma caproni]|uniref:EamA domain-containing protein n=1 Tax=Echinostoma caproni TaxID=27848 RepID=A0A183AZ23_9TREM|nr:unnamed protein product [Echinostoma caproni]